MTAKLNGLPLALNQAGTYIGQTGIDVQTYIEYFDSKWIELLGEQDRFSSRADDERSLLTTYMISYEQVLQQSEAAAALLRLWAFFHYGDVWYGLLARGGMVARKMEIPWLIQLTENDFEFSNAVRLLATYSLVNSPGSGSWSMHPVLHRWCLSLSSGGDIGTLKTLVLSLLGVAAPTKDDIEYWKLDQRLLPHVLHALDEHFLLQEFDQEGSLALICHALGDLLRRQNKLEAAERMYERAIAGHEKALGSNHTSTLDTVNNLGNLYAAQGKLEAAKGMCQRAVTGYEKTLGSGHTSTLDAVVNLGTIHAKQGELDVAELMYERALAGKEKTLGSNDISMLDVVDNLGNLYAIQGKLDAAEQMYQRSLAGRRKTLGSDHISIMETVSNLGNLYRDQGKLDEAEQMYRRALAGYEKAYGPDHISMMRTLNNFGLLYRDQGKLDEAEQMYQRALAGFEKAHGPDHISAMETVSNLGTLYRDQGKLDEAEQMYQRALAGFEKAYGPDDTSTLTTVRNLGLLYCEQVKPDKAKQMLGRLRADDRKRLAKRHPRTFGALHALNSLGVQRGIYCDSIIGR